MSSFEVLLAIILQLIATSANFIGMTIQKKATASMPIITEEASIRASFVNFITNKAWLLGFFLNSSSSFFTMGAFALASLSVIQPLYGFGLIVLVVFSRYYLKEKITTMDLIGVFVGICGIILLGVIAEAEIPIAYPILYNYFLSIKGLIFLLIVLAIAIISFLISESVKSSLSIIFLVISSAIWTALQFLFSKGIATVISDIGIISALFGEGWYYSWIFLAAFIFVSVIGLLMLNVAYQKGQCVIIVPVWASIQVFLPVLAGIFIFNEWASYSWLDILLRTIGIVVMLISIIILSISNGRKEDKVYCNIKEERTKNSD